MWNDEPQGREFWEHLTRVDLAHAEQVRAEGCRDCGAPLDRSDYPRKPRGALGFSGPFLLIHLSSFE